MSKRKKWTILYCDAQLKICPISDFIDTLPAKHQIKILRFLELLEEMGPTLPRPYTDILQDGIHELRITLSGDPVRFLYFFCFKDYIVFYHAFWKNTDRVPSKYISKTIRYREELLARTDKNQLKVMAGEGI